MLVDLTGLAGFYDDSDSRPLGLPEQMSGESSVSSDDKTRRISLEPSMDSSPLLSEWYGGMRMFCLGN